MRRRRAPRMRLDPEAWPFAAVLALLAIGAAWWSPWLAILPAVGVLFVLNFFRDPERAVPAEPGALVSPACGKIVRADAQRVSIFMNVFDVHVCRAPAAGRVDAVVRTPGRFLAAFADHASEHNERTSIVIARERGGPVRFTLVAGLVARRIVCRVKAGDALDAGARVGIIRFGSRVDVDLPEGTAPAVAVGARVISGETVIARPSGSAIQ